MSKQEVEQNEGFKPPQGAAAAARRGLELREKFNRGGTAVGVARARDLQNRKYLSLDTIGRMVSFFARHSVNAEAKGSKSRGFWRNNSNPSAGWVAWLLWGGDAGRRWANKIWEREKKKKKVAKAAEGELINFLL